MSNVIREAKYIKSDVVKNNNKFWYITEYDDCSILLHWGRVGDDGQKKPKPFSSQSAASSFFDKKCREKEKSRNGEIPYRPLNVIGGSENIVQGSTKKIADSKVKEIAKKQIKTNNPTVIKLIEYFSKVNAHNITQATGGQITYNDTTGLFSTPLGIVTQENIDDANDILLEIGDLVADSKYGVKLKNRTNDYLMLVPQNIGRKQLDLQDFWADVAAVQQQKSIVDSLQASLVSATSTGSKKKTKTPEKKVFDVELFLVKDKKVIDRIKKKYNKTRQSMHSCNNLKVKTVYTVQIGNMKRGFDGCKVGGKMELWHGTRASNVLSILKGGLVVPPASSSNVTGRMFGDGLYFSDQSTKSLNYSYGYWGGGNRDSNCFMFLADVAMGKYYVPSGSYDGPFPRNGYDSVFAKAHKSGVYNNEMIVYKLNQCNLTYLIEFA